MRILMIAPEPFFEPRGTPFSQFHRIRALTALGHQIDLVTYPFGQRVSMPGLRVFRSLGLPFVRHIRVGPSLAKIPFDALLALTAIRRALARRYDAIHSHEEGALIGACLAAVLRVPHLYDMHSSLPQQLTNFAFSRSRVVRRLFLALERFMIRRSRVVIVICPSLEDTVRAIEPRARMVVIENAPGSVEAQATAEQAATIRRALGLDPGVAAVTSAPPGRPGTSERPAPPPAPAWLRTRSTETQTATPMILYTGTFEAYQGLDLLFDAMAQVARVRPDAWLVLAGGNPDQVARAREAARHAGVEAVTIFAGERPAAEIPAYLLAADVLVSPRSRGTNTPLKIYQYLRSGKPIVATRLLTHTQVLSDDTAILTGPTPQGFADGIIAALNDPTRARRVGLNARCLAETKYSYEAYLEKTRQACELLAPPPAALGAEERRRPGDGVPSARVGRAGAPERGWGPTPK